MFGLSATVVGAAAGLGGAALGAWSSSKSAKDTNAANARMQQESIEAQKEAAKIDPRIESMLYGSGTTTRQLKSGAMGSVEKIDGVTRRVYSDDDYENVTTGKGLLDQGMDYLNKPQSAGLQAVGQSADASLLNNYAKDQETQRWGAANLMTAKDAPQMQSAQSLGVSQMGAAQGLLSATAAPTAYNTQAANSAKVGAPQSVSASTVNAPSQNNLDLSGAYNSFINGESGNNPYLTGAIQKGINQSKTAFENMQTDATRNLTENVLGNIRGGAVSSGQYGGSRQGLAESNAVKDFSTQMGRAVSQFGQNNTDAAVAAQSNQYGQDQANKLNALNTLSGQQYGVAGQNAQMGQQAAMQNAQMGQQAQMQDAQNQQQTNMFNAGNQTAANRDLFGASQQVNLSNTGAANDMARFNAGNQQQANQLNTQMAQQNQQFNAQNQQATNQQNLGAQLNTNQMNNANFLGGMNALAGFGANDYNLANQNQNYDFNKVQQVSGLLQPYAGKGSPINVPQYQNMSSNPLGGAIGGATAAMGLYNMFKPSPTPAVSSGSSNYTM